MVKSLYKSIRTLWKNPTVMKDLNRERLIKWRKEPRFQKIENPIRIDKARQLGYKAKKGFIIVRGRIERGGRRRHLYGRRGRKPSKSGLTSFTPKQPMHSIIEARIQRKYPNLEVLGSYPVGEDGVYKWFEVIMVDPERPEIKNDKNINWITEKQHRKRILRGLP